MINVKDIVRQWLQDHGYDGLANDDCGCHLDNFMPCGEMHWECVAARVGPCDCSDHHDEHLVPVDANISDG